MVVAASTIIALGDGEAALAVTTFVLADVGRDSAASSARNAIVVRHWVKRTNASQTLANRRSSSSKGGVPSPWDDARGVFIDIVAVAASDIGMASRSPFRGFDPSWSGENGPCDPSVRRKEDCTYVDIARKFHVNQSHKLPWPALGCLDNNAIASA